MIIRKNSARALIQPESQPIELLLQREFVFVREEELAEA
jgi:hypothetical protein